MNNLSEWWCNDNRLIGEDYNVANQYCNRDAGDYTREEWESLKESLKHRIPMGYTLDKHILYVENTATQLITALFDKYMDDETLLITSKVEHEAVLNNVVSHSRVDKDHVILHFTHKGRDINLAQIKQAVKSGKYKRAFVYIIGTQITTGETTSQSVYLKIRDCLIESNITPIMVIDDVHGMYLVPRDYSVFDYVISTAHALARHYDMGILWSKTVENFGFKNCYWVREYIKCLDYLLDRKYKLATFSEVMKEEFHPYLQYDYIHYISDSVPHIFSIKVDCNPNAIYNEDLRKEYADHEVRLETDNNNLFYIRMRGQQFITFPELLEGAIDRVHNTLKRIIAYKEMCND